MLRLRHRYPVTARNSASGAPVKIASPVRIVAPARLGLSPSIRCPFNWRGIRLQVRCKPTAAGAIGSAKAFAGALSEGITASWIARLAARSTLSRFLGRVARPAHGGLDSSQVFGQVLSVAVKNLNGLGIPLGEQRLCHFGQILLAQALWQGQIVLNAPDKLL